MECRLCAILWLVSCLFYENKGIIANADFYTAGVVEFRPTISGMSSSDLVADHLQAYLKIIASTEANDTDIIVFPEGTLNNDFQSTYVPAGRDDIIPCLTNGTNLYADFFIELSCAARRFHKYLVINLTEKENCSSVLHDPRPCSSNDLNVFNTNVVFDREGRVISRYRKVHVYVENKNTTYEPEYAIFDTDFGVRFGHFICFDMLFYTPAQEMVDKFGIQNFIFTSLFFSELPFLTAVQLQHSWAWGNNVNLLAAGASYPQSGTTGTGIYAGSQGDLISIMVKGEGERKLYKTRVPKTAHAPDINRSTEVHPNSARSYIRLLKDPQIQNYTSVLLDLKGHANITRQLCQGDFCCTFEIVADTLNVSPTYVEEHYKYRIGVFDGRRTYEKEEWSNIEVCALYACINENASSCGELITEEDTHPVVTFKHISILGTFPKSNKLLIMPTMLDEQLYPLKYDQVKWDKEKKSNYYEVKFTLTKDHKSILTFGIYANYYDTSPTISSALIITMEFPVILLIFFKLLHTTLL